MAISVDEFSSIEDVLDRRVALDSLPMLQVALAGKKAGAKRLDAIAIGLDANVFLKLSNHHKRADIIDYFGGRHQAPLIVPGQVVQEFWNNQFSAMQSVSTGLKSRFDALGVEIAKVDARFGDFSVKIDEIMADMNAEFGYVRDSKTVSNLASICEMLVTKASVVYVPRTRFNDIAAQRKRTRTPPGFKDEGDGDFFVWADFLYALIKERRLGHAFEHCVLVTDDRKLDWSLNGLVHPLLSAEVLALTGASFDIWGIDRLGREISEFLDLAENPE